MSAAALISVLALAPFGQIDALPYRESVAPYRDGGSIEGSVRTTTRTRSVRARTASGPRGASDDRFGYDDRLGYDDSRVAYDEPGDFGRARDFGRGDDYERMPPVMGRDFVEDDPESARAAKLLKGWIAPSIADQRARTITLFDAIAKTNGAKQQIDVVKLYWNWVLSMAELRGMVDEDAALAEIAGRNPPRTGYEQAMLRAAVEACRARLAEAKRDVVGRLVDLQEATGLRSNEAQIPNDFPYVGAYDTRYERMFGGRTAPANLRKIHNTLPESLAVIRARAIATDEALRLMADAAAGHAQRQVALSEVLEAVHGVRSQRRAFLDAVNDYNVHIAEYALSVAGPNVTRESVVSMLIRRPTLPYGRGRDLYDAPAGVLVDSRAYDGRAFEGRGYDSRAYEDRGYGRATDGRVYSARLTDRRGYDPRAYDPNTYDLNGYDGRRYATRGTRSSVEPYRDGVYRDERLPDGRYRDDRYRDDFNAPTMATRPGVRNDPRYGAPIDSDRRVYPIGQEPLYRGR